MPNDLGWKNNIPQQLEFIEAAFDPRYLYVGYIGGRGAGKTLALDRVVLEACYRYPGIRIMLATHSFKALRIQTQYEFMRMLRASGRPFREDRENEMVFVTAQGGTSEVYFRSFQMPGLGRGPTLGMVAIDEARSVTQSQADACQGSLRQPNTPQIFLIATTPTGSHHWTSQWFVRPQKPDCKTIKASSYDNPNLGGRFVKRMEQTYTGDYRRREIMGEVVDVGGGVYSGFNPQYYPAGNLLPADQCQPKPHWEVLSGMDFGWRHPEARIWAAINDDGQLVIFDEYKVDGEVAQTHVQAMSHKPYHNVNTFADPSNPQMIAEHQVSGMEWLVPAIRQSPLGTEETLKGLSWKSRMHVLLNGYLATRRVLISDACPQLQEELLNLEFADADEDDEGDGTKSERTTKILDDLIDSTHYLMTALPVELTAPTKPPGPEAWPHTSRMTILDGGRLIPTDKVEEAMSQWM